MKKQKIALYLVAFICFATCFFVLNRKYDKFYRINGINNENRQLITNYLSKKEQNYLVENSFPMERFSRFLQLSDFNLFDLEYYEQVESKTKNAPGVVVTYTNQLLEKLRNDENANVASDFNRLMTSDLYDLYLNVSSFSLEIFDFYEIYHQIFGTIQAGDIEQLNELNIVMKNDKLSSQERNKFLEKWARQYRIEDLMNFWQQKHDNPKLELIENPDSLTTVISKQQTISSYEPEPLTIPYNVSRVRFACYLRQDATVALEEMFNACSEAVETERLLLVEAYQSFDELEANGKRETEAEYQLGLTVDFMSMDIAYNRFKDTKVSEFLVSHSWEYGFILRYPDPTSEFYSANTYRFVGKDAAKVMHEKNLSLEAYEGIKNE